MYCFTFEIILYLFVLGFLQAPADLTVINWNFLVKKVKLLFTIFIWIEIF